MFYLHEITKVLAENKGLKLTAKLLPKEVAAEVNVMSFIPETRNVAVWIDKADGCWNPDPENKVKFTLKSGESKTFRIKLKDAAVKDGWSGTVTFAMSTDGEVPVFKKYLLGGNFARYSDIAEIGKDWTFRKYRMREFSIRKKGLGFSWSQGYAWNEKGLFLATVVEDEDYFPPDSSRPYYRSDSVQYFIDGKNLTIYDATVYNSSVMTLVAEEENRKFNIIHTDTPKYGVPAKDSRIKMEYHRENGKSYWELFIPANELPDVKFKKGTVFGISVMINNRMKNKSGAEIHMFNDDVSPYMRPGIWEDLILTDENGKL